MKGIDTTTPQGIDTTTQQAMTTNYLLWILALPTADVNASYQSGLN